MADPLRAEVYLRPGSSGQREPGVLLGAGGKTIGGPVHIYIYIYIYIY